MRVRLPLSLLVLLLVLPAAASASAYRVGIGDQNAAMFSAPAFEKLGIKKVRYLVPWDYTRYAGQAAEVAGFLGAAHAARKDVFVTFTASRGCWTGVRYSRAKHCRAPSAAAYARAVRGFRKAYPFVRTFATWNEMNHVSQPTASSARRAAGYYNALRRVCRGCTLVAADVLDQSNVVPYLRSFLRYAKGHPRRFGLHNYSDVNRRRIVGTASVLRAVPGEVWLTETGGVVRFAPNFPYSLSRAAARERYMFQLADRYSHHRAGLRSRITRIYPYAWSGGPKGTRFDAGLTDEHGRTRPAYKVFASYVRKRSK
jgi:hypothetical protein